MADPPAEPKFRDRLWFNWQQPASPLLLGGTVDACGPPFREFFGFPIFTSIVYYRNLDRGRGYQASWLLRIEEGVACGRLLVDALSVPSFQARLNREINASFGALGLAGKEHKRLDLQRLDEEELIGSFEDFQRLFVAFYRIGAITEPVTWYVEHFFREFLEEEKDSGELKGPLREWPAQRIEAAAFMTDEEPYTLEIERSLAGVAGHLDALAARGEALDLAEPGADWEGIEAHHPELAIAASRHAENFPWKANNYRFASPLTGADVLAELFGMHAEGSLRAHLLAAVAEAEERRSSMAEDRARLFEICPPAVRGALRTGDRYGSGLADRRKAAMLPALEVIASFARELARRSEIEYELVLSLTPGEVGGFVRDPDPYRERLEGRRRALVQVQAPFAIDEAEMSARLRLAPEDVGLPRKDDVSLVEGPEALEFLDRIDTTMGLFHRQSAGGVSGEVVVAPPAGGILEGRCRVISDPRADRLEPGEILVATSTTPDFMPAIRNAGALLVDQAGILSHAALTSRELGKPCIVAAGHATSTFRTGDLLRLDFDAGTAIAVEEAADGQ
jgi:phosphohistidine swiveling domain-containing protein